VPARTANRIPSLLVMGQKQPFINKLSPKDSAPIYFADAVFNHVASLLGLDVKNHIAPHSVSILATLWFSLIALKKIKNSCNSLVIIWQGYGTYAILLGALLGIKKRFILNTYKVPLRHSQSLKKRLNDWLLKKAILMADGVVSISRVQVDELKLNNSNVNWVPFAPDLDWWTPGAPDLALLAIAGIGYRDYVLILGDADRDEKKTLNALRGLNYPVLRVTREPRIALIARRAFRQAGITQGEVLVNVPFEVLRELYRGARVVVVPAKSSVHPAGMTSLTEAMSCGRPVVIPSGLATEGYVQDDYDAFVLDEWEESAIRDRVVKIYETEIGESIGRNARNTVEERLNFHASAKILVDFMTSIVAAGNTARRN